MSKFIEQIYKSSKNYSGIIFLDRDGTINEEVDYLGLEKQMKILPTVAEGIHLLNKKKIAVVVITNQPVVARGLVSINKLKQINDELFEALTKRGVYLDAIYSCPHHPERDHSDIPKNALRFRVKCKCRKPGTEMLERAVSVFGTKKVLGIIGDQTRDTMAGKNLKAPTVIVETGYKGKDGTYDETPDFLSETFIKAVEWLFKN